MLWAASRLTRPRPRPRPLGVFSARLVCCGLPLVLPGLGRDRGLSESSRLDAWSSGSCCCLSASFRSARADLATTCSAGLGLLGLKALDKSPRPALQVARHRLKLRAVAIGQRGLVCLGHPKLGIEARCIDEVCVERSVGRYTKRCKAPNHNPSLRFSLG